MVVTEEMAPKVKASQGYIGRAMKRVEDPRLIKGIATYVDDLKIPGMLHAEFVRSPHANAKIKSIDFNA
jgi:carbon-monoxide dehydrogenase large subunit